MNIWIRDRQRKQRLPLGKIRKKLRALLLGLGMPDAEISVLFIGDRAMRSLNRRYRGRDRATDVLSFPMREAGSPPVHYDLLGDIVISAPRAAKQAALGRRDIESEIDVLLVHGVLHLIGYDHERGKMDAHKMQRKERRLLKLISS